MLDGLGRLAELREQIESSAEKAKGKVAKGLLAHKVASALVTGSIFLLLGGTAWGLATLVHPAVAAVAVGGTVLLAVVIGMFLAIRSPKH